MSNLFEVGDEVILKEDFGDYESVYNGGTVLNALTGMHELVGVKLTIYEKHINFPMLYKVNDIERVKSSYWLHENWLEFYKELFELGEELFLI